MMELEFLRFISKKNNTNLSVGVAKLRPAEQFNSARQIPCTAFSSTTFPTVNSSATVLSESVNKMVWCYCYYCTTIYFNNLFLHRLRKSHCIQSSSGQAIANLALGSKRLASPVLVDRTVWIRADDVYLRSRRSICTVRS